MFPCRTCEANFFFTAVGFLRSAFYWFSISSIVKVCHIWSSPWQYRYIDSPFLLLKQRTLQNFQICPLPLSRQRFRLYDFWNGQSILEEFFYCCIVLAPISNIKKRIGFSILLKIKLGPFRPLYKMCNITDGITQQPHHIIGHSKQ